MADNIIVLKQKQKQCISKQSFMKLHLILHKLVLNYDTEVWCNCMQGRGDIIYIHTVSISHLYPLNHFVFICRWFVVVASTDQLLHANVLFMSACLSLRGLVPQCYKANFGCSISKR